MRTVTAVVAALWSTFASAQVCTIKTIADLQKMSLSGTYCLAKDIDATGMPAIAPIGDNNNPFVGKWDGHGYSINGLKITGTGIYVGLFAELGVGGTVSNIGLTNVSVNGTLGYDVGGLVGRNRGTISNSYTTGSVTGTAGGQFGLAGIAVGGLVGWNFGTITQSYSTTSITSTSNSRVSLGGLSGGSTGTIQLSHATGQVSGHSGNSNTGLVEIGVLVGELGDFNGDSGVIIDSFATGAVMSTGSNTAAGGLVGGATNPDYAPHAAFLGCSALTLLHAHAVDRSGLDRCASTRCATRVGLICRDRRRVGAQRPAA